MGQRFGKPGRFVGNHAPRQSALHKLLHHFLHTIEHLLASLLRDRVDGLIDISPFGCRTGFHLIMWGRPEVPALVDAITDSLRFIAEEAQ